MKHSPAPKLRQPRQHLNQPTVWPIDADASRLRGLGRRQWRLQPSLSDWRTALDPARPQASILSNHKVRIACFTARQSQKAKRPSHYGVLTLAAHSTCQKRKNVARNKRWRSRIMEEPMAMARLAWIASELGFRNRLSEGNRHTAEASTRRGSGVLAGRCVLYPPHSTPLLFPDSQCLPNWSTPGLLATRRLSKRSSGRSRAMSIGFFQWLPKSLQST